MNHPAPGTDSARTPGTALADVDWRRPVIGGVLTGAWGSVPLWRAPFAVRAVLVALPAGAVSAVTGLELRRRSGDRARGWRAPAAALALGGALGAAGVASFAIDRGTEKLLVRLGIRRPRLVLGIAGGALYTVADLFEAAAEAREASAPDDAAP